MERSKITIPLMAALVIAAVFCPDLTLAACTSNSDCPANQYCEKTAGDCDGTGECTLKPWICPLNYDPVCGCDKKTYSNDCIAEREGVNVNYLGECRLLGELLVDTNFNDSTTSTDLRDDRPRQDWYESRGDKPPYGPDLLTLNEQNTGSNRTNKAKLLASDDYSAYLTQEFSSHQSGTFTVRWNIYVEEIWPSDYDRGAMMMIGDNSAEGTTSDEGKGPNSTSGERFVFMAFRYSSLCSNDPAYAQTMSLIASQPDDPWNDTCEWTNIADGLEVKRWHTIAVVCDVARDTYDVYVNGALEAVNVKAYTGKDIVTHISFAQFSGAPATFYIDNVVTPLGDETKLLASDGDPTDNFASDHFGTSVAVNRDLALIGAPDYDSCCEWPDGFFDDSGVVYAYHYKDGGWVNEPKFLPLSRADGNQIGRSVAISDDVAVVGAPEEDYEDSPDVGSVYIGNHGASGWSQEQQLLASDVEPSAFFGTSVAISGDVAVVGAPGKDNKNGGNAGSVYVYHYGGSSWEQEQELLASDGDYLDNFGKSVAISGNVAIIGAPEDDDKGSSSGSAYIYRYIYSDFAGFIWVEEDKVLASDGENYDRFGYSVAISGNVAAVGAPFDNNVNGTRAGAVYIYRYDGSKWDFEDKLLASVGDRDDNFGKSVAISGDVVVVGAPAEWIGGETEGWEPSGAAHVYCFVDSEWVERRRLLATDGHIMDYFGSSIALSGDVAMVGAPFNDEKDDAAGAAYVFTNLCCTDNDNDGYSAEGEACGPVDCNDNDSSIHPGATEQCNLVDDDCDGQVDEGTENTYYQDADGDGYGNPNVETKSCAQPSGYVNNNQDCDDDNSSIHPGATEQCNLVDDDCDGQVDEGTENTYYQDADGDGYGNPNVETKSCTQPSGYVNNNQDCDDNDSNKHPNQTWYKDADNDGYSDGTTNTSSCTRPSGYKIASELTSTSGDCNDNNTSIHPGATEQCNLVDDNCNGQVDEICDTDNDGILDGDEDVNDNGNYDPGETDSGNSDTDGDGIQDGTELGLTLDDIGPATDRNIFRPDMDPKTKTDPFNNDTDGDNLDDGQEDANHNGRIDPCETDPTLPDELTVVINQIVTTSYPTMDSFVEVTNEDGKFIDNLTDSNFSVTEDGVLQSPITVKPPGIYEPISVALCLDYSNTMDINDKKFLMEEAAKSFIQQLGPDDAAEIIRFATEVEVAQPFTTDKNALLAAISDSDKLGKQTALYDAIYQAVTDTSAQKGQRAVIVITDGKDFDGQKFGTEEELEAVIQYAVSNNVPVYTIGLGLDIDEEALDKIAKQSGGEYHYAPQSSHLEAIYQAIAEVLLNQYLVSYTTKSRGSRSHVLDVRVSSAGLIGSDCQEFVIDRGGAMPWIPLLLLEE